MKHILFLISAFLMGSLLAGCNTPVTANMTPAQASAAQAQAAANIQTHQYQLCLIYHDSSPVIANKLRTLPQASASALYAATQQATRLCSTALTNNTQAAQQLTQAFVTISTLAGVAKLTQ